MQRGVVGCEEGKRFQRRKKIQNGLLAENSTKKTAVGNGTGGGNMDRAGAKTQQGSADEAHERACAKRRG